MRGRDRVNGILEGLGWGLLFGATVTVVFLILRSLGGARPRTFHVTILSVVKTYLLGFSMAGVVAGALFEFWGTWSGAAFAGFCSTIPVEATVGLTSDGFDLSWTTVLFLAA